MSYGTFKGYRNTRNQVIEWLELNKLQGIRLLEVDSSTANHLFEYLKNTKGVANKTYNHHLAFLRAVYTFFGKREDGVNVRNPFGQVEKKKVPKSKKHAAFTNAQIEAIHKLILAKGDKQLYLYSCQSGFPDFRRAAVPPLSSGTRERRMEDLELEGY